MGTTQSCIFCRIIAGEIPAARLIETDAVISFMDIAPVNRGHCLVVPKRHAVTLPEMTEEEVRACAGVIWKLAPAVVKATGAEGFNVLQNNGACAGQVVQHVHYHIIPRRSDDGWRFGWRQLKYAEGEMATLHGRIRGLL